MSPSSRCPVCIFPASGVSPPARFWRQAVVIALSMIIALGSSPGLFGQEENAAAGDRAAAPASISDVPVEKSVYRMLLEGSTLGLAIVILILVLSVLSTYFIIVNAVTITRKRLIPENVMNDLERMLADGEINSAIAWCHDRDNWSMATEVIAAGLQRFQASEFGFAEYRSAIEEAGEDQVGRLYRKTEILNVIGSIAPMLGLLGTVVGMIEAFTRIAGSEGMAQPGELAGGIAQALVTTLLGLMVAIPTMVALSWFRTRIDSLVAEAGKRIERIMSPLARKKTRA